MFSKNTIVVLCEKYISAADMLCELRCERVPRRSLIREYEALCAEIEERLEDHLRDLGKTRH